MRKVSLTKVMQVLGKRMRQMYSQNQKGIKRFFQRKQKCYGGSLEEKVP